MRKKALLLLLFATTIASANLLYRVTPAGPAVYDSRTDLTWLDNMQGPMAAVQLPDAAARAGPGWRVPTRQEWYALVSTELGNSLQDIPYNMALSTIKPFSSLSLCCSWDAVGNVMIEDLAPMFWQAQSWVHLGPDNVQPGAFVTFVQSGDVGVVPEPSTAMLSLAGLYCLWGAHLLRSIAYRLRAVA
jgi:hypothetical protein